MSTHAPVQPPFFLVRNPFLLEGAVAKLLEPPEACERDLNTRLADGSYDKPFVLEQGDQRSLYFSLRFLQSGMRLSDPWALELPYSRAMMAFLLFHSKPRRVLLLGLGGGSLAKFCFRNLPGADVTAVEINPHVLAFREEFRVPPDDHRFRVVEGDGARYVAETAQKWDAILVDAFDHEGVAPALASGRFHEDALSRLSGRGILVMNLAGDLATQERHRDDLAQAFGGRLLSLPLRKDGNEVVFAFKEGGFLPQWKTLRVQAPELERRFSLDFPSFARQLESCNRSWRG